MAFEIGTDGIGGLAVGFDGSDPSRDALAFSAGVARRNAGTLTVVYVIATGAEGVAVLAPGAAAVIGASERETVERMRGEVEQALVGLEVH